MYILFMYKFHLESICSDSRGKTFRWPAFTDGSGLKMGSWHSPETRVEWPLVLEMPAVADITCM